MHVRHTHVSKIYFNNAMKMLIELSIYNKGIFLVLLFQNFFILERALILE
jgi:hypothetical protein